MELYYSLYNIQLYNWKLFMKYLSESVCGMLYGSDFSGEFHELFHRNIVVDRHV
jgi:hypothetical protein